MTVKELIVKNRSYRRFDATYNIDRKLLEELVDLARLSASARNAQPLKYVLANTKKVNDRIFPTTAWAGYLKDWEGPIEGERPTAYIVVLQDTEVAKEIHCDDGIAMQSILLGATEKGLGGCILGSLKKEELQKVLGIPEQYNILNVIALGRPIEEVQLEEIEAGGDVKYYRDEQQIHHVPKRKLEDIIL